ncbi:hypothetical protein ACHAPE_001452 [Trichoderma viride]
MDKKGQSSKGQSSKGHKKPKSGGSSAGGSSGGRQHGESSSSSKKSGQSYSLNRYLETPQRHETWDWEQKGQRRSDKNHRL